MCQAQSLSLLRTVGDLDLTNSTTAAMNHINTLKSTLSHGSVHPCFTSGSRHNACDDSRIPHTHSTYKYLLHVIIYLWAHHSASKYTTPLQGTSLQSKAGILIAGVTTPLQKDGRNMIAGLHASANIL